MNARAKRQQALIDELHAIANRLDALMFLEGVFPEGDAYLDGQCNSCLTIAYQQLEAVVSTIGDQYHDALSAPNENFVLQIVERRGKPSSTRGLEATPAAKNGVVRAGKRAVARMVAGVAR
jgi:hypothetical protein